MREKYIIVSSLLACICLYIVEQHFGASYVVKTASKLILFVGFPLIYMRFMRKSTGEEERNLTKIDRRHFSLGIFFGAISFAIIIIAYFLFNRAINLQDIARDLNAKNITSDNFIFIGLYITFGNSFLEEFFFRGFVFLSLYEMKKEKLAYVFSSLLFGLYHIAIFKTWFSLGIIVLCMIGLVTVGFIFNWLDTKSNNFINSWIVHILADSAIILIGLKMFQII